MKKVAAFSILMEQFIVKVDYGSIQKDGNA